MAKDQLKKYYNLTKPGIVYSNTATAISGYFYGSDWHINWLKLIYLGLGSILVIAASCVLNNLLDRGIDSKMARTKTRALVTQDISVSSAFTYAFVLLIVGLILISKTNALTFMVVAFASLSYVFVYGYFKRRSIYGTLVGTLPGAASLVAGYTLGAGRLDFAALILFLIMMSWQMVHFYAISIFRLKDYKAAGLPIWSVKKGIASTRQQMLIFLILFILANLALTLFGYNGITYAFAMTLLGLYWLRKYLDDSNAEAWARTMFFTSLKVLLAFMLLLPLANLLP